MACEYYSYSVFEKFADRKILQAAVNRIGRKGFYVTGISGDYQVEAQDRGRMNELKQAYQVEAARAALKKKGFFVSETKDQNTGKIRLTVRA